MKLCTHDLDVMFMENMTRVKTFIVALGKTVSYNLDLNYLKCPKWYRAW